MERRRFLRGVIGLLGAPAASPGEWPEWRGASRDGAVAAAPRKGNWPEKLALLWEREVGEGYPGPVAAGDRVWIHARRGNREVVSCLRLASGTVVWTAEYDAPFEQDESARMHGRGPYSTPALADGRLFTFGVNSVLSVWDAGAGKLLWRKESAKEFNPGFPFFGQASSPLVWGGLLFVHMGGHDRKQPMEAPGVGAIVALSVADGRETWRWSKQAPAIAASPLICNFEGWSQLVFKTNQHLVGLDPVTGQELWQFPCKVPMDNTIVTPLVADGRLLNSDYEQGVSAWRIQSTGASWTARQLWRTREASLSMSSPVLAGGQVVGFSHFRKGQLFGLDPSDGRLLWQGEPRSGEHATLISWGDEVLAFLEDGSLVVGGVARDGFRPLQTYRLGNSGGWAHPAVAGGRLLLRDGSRLAAYRLDAES